MPIRLTGGSGLVELDGLQMSTNTNTGASAVGGMTVTGIDATTEVLALELNGRYAINSFYLTNFTGTTSVKIEIDGVQVLNSSYPSSVAPSSLLYLFASNYAGGVNTPVNTPLLVKNNLKIYVTSAGTPSGQLNGNILKIR